MPPAASPSPADALLRDGELESEHVRAAAAWLAAHQRDLPSAPGPDGVEAHTRTLAAQVDAIAAAWPALAGAELAEIARAQRDFLDHHGEHFAARARQGRIVVPRRRVLRLADLCISDRLAVELAHGEGEPALEAPRDACMDAASLALDLAVGLRGDLAERLLSSYAAEADDFDLYAVVDFCERDCALARAAAGARAAPECNGDEMRALLLAALATSRRLLVPPSVVAVGGQVASGKSTAARALAERLGAPRIEADRTRAHLAGDEPLASFEPGFEDAVYRELLRRARLVLESGRPAVIDACFPRAAQRAAVRTLARERGWPFLFVEVRVAPAVARARLAQRDATSGSGGWRELHRNLAEHWEAEDGLSPDERLVLAGDAPLEENQRRIESRIPAWPEGLPG